MSHPGDVPPEILDRLRPICRLLPEAYEEPAWTGVRWRIRARTVAHVYTPDPDSSPAYAQYAIGGEAPTVMTFRVPVEDLLGLTSGGFPFFRAPRSEEHTSELQSRQYLVCRLLLEKKKTMHMPLLTHTERTLYTA